jgi:predicted O-methyltransferase YrrM|tara:strand:+ start:21589 stop:22113 length:525 start_codon:yes stop_codon:yes gene_type:complete
MENRRDIEKTLGHRWSHWETGLIIDKLVQEHKPQTFVELGSLGSFLPELLARVYKDLKIIAVDVQFQRPLLWKRYKNIFQINNWTVNASRLFDDESIDFVYVDADHSYKGCMADLEAWYPKLKKGGILSGHDYGEHPDKPEPDFPGVTRAVDEFFDAQSVELHQENYMNFWGVK